LKPVKIGICGLGTVGSGTFNVLAKNKQLIESRANCELHITQIGARRDNPACDLTGMDVQRDIFTVANNPEIDILVELVGGTTVAKDLVLQAIANGKHVVTANKALIAEFGNEIFAAAAVNKVIVAYEGAVAAGFPVIKAIREGLAANKIEWLAGIINGTGNYILTEMGDKKRDFSDVLKEAQDKGYAEADPTFDVEGIDAAHKLVILASIAFAMPLQYDKVFMEGVSQVETKDIENAQKLGYRIKHIGIARESERGVELRVHPTLIPEKRLIANVNGVMNAVLVKSDAAGATLYYGAGAGDKETASSVVADIVDVARHICAEAKTSIPPLGSVSLAEKPVLPIEQIQTAYYLRLVVDDKPGVLSQLTTVLSDESIGIEAMHQEELEKGETCAEIVLLTDQSAEASLLKAVKKMEALSFVHGDVKKIRVEALG